ncbi:gas vesicle protein [Streptomyces sp. NPDC059070]|uniref:gas vesicle protein n=1 Tax=unclassified Streptomyces TaxID=2593676 RepID=UPI0034E2D080
MSTTTAADEVHAGRELALVDLLDRVLAGGVVLAGDLTLRIADVDLVRIDLHALVGSVSAALPSPFEDAYGTDEHREGT